jgi:hypothetical protein
MLIFFQHFCNVIATDIFAPHNLFEVVEPTEIGAQPEKTKNQRLPFLASQIRTEKAKLPFKQTIFG